MAQARGESLWLMSANQASFSSNHVWHRFTFSSPFIAFSPFSCLILPLFCNLPTHSASLKRTSQPRLMHLGPHLLYGASSGSNEHNPFHTKSWEITHHHSHTHTNTAPRAGMIQHVPLVTHALVVIEVKEKKQQADFGLVWEGRGIFLPLLLLRIIWWNCPPAHRRQELG